MNATLVAAPVATKTKTSRPAANGKCPSGCAAPVPVRGSSAKCGDCGLVAPRSAFLANGQSTNANDGVTVNRAWTIGGAVD
jgi:hypothetical protein